MLQKPQWLVDFLNALNWDIFTWHIYVGDTVENAIDWVIDIIDTIITWMVQVGNWWEEFRQEVVDFFRLVPQWINEAWQFILNFWDTIGDIIATWWEAVYQTVKDWVNTIIDGVKDALKVVSDTLTQWVTTVENFFTSILPTLASKLDVADLIKNAFQPWRELLNFLVEIKNELVEFFTDPLQWAYNKMDEFFERFW